MKLRLANASQLSWSWGLAWLSLAICLSKSNKYSMTLNVQQENFALIFVWLKKCRIAECGIDCVQAG